MYLRLAKDILFPIKSFLYNLIQFTPDVMGLFWLPFYPVFLTRASVLGFPFRENDVISLIRKRTILDQETLINYRPISGLTFLTKFTLRDGRKRVFIRFYCCLFSNLLRKRKGADKNALPCSIYLRLDLKTYNLLFSAFSVFALLLLKICFFKKKF